MGGIPRLVVASGNRKKAQEIIALLSLGETPLPLTNGELGVLADFPDAPPIAETGDSFVENAMLKARAVSCFLRDRKKLRNVLVLADDSGLVVPALGNRPGIWSARFALRAIEEGLVGSEYREPYLADPDATNIDVLLALLVGYAEAERQARFVCELAIALDGDILNVSHGACEGVIAERRRGTGGFGYDPVFLHPPLQRTFGELPPEAKHEVSHRRAASRQARPVVLHLLAELSPRKLAPNGASPRTPSSQ